MSWHEIKQKEQRMGMLVSERASMADINIKKIFPTSTVDNKEKLFLEKVRLLNKVDDDFEGIKIKRIDQRYQNQAIFGFERQEDHSSFINSPMLPVDKKVKKKLKIKSPPKKYSNFKIHIQKKESLENPFQSFKLL